MVENSPQSTNSEVSQSTKPEIRPWPPIPMVLVTMFGGLPAGGLLLGLNWSRFGDRPRAHRDLLMFAGITVGTVVLATLWAGGPEQSEEHQARVRWAMQSIHVLVALGVAFQQRGRFEQFLAEGGRPGNVFLALPLALGFGILVQFALARIVGRILMAQ